MFSARAGFGTFSKMAGVAVNPFEVVRRFICLAVLLVSASAVSPAQLITITEYPAAGALGIAGGPDGALWFTNNSSSNAKIFRITTAGMLTEYALPNPFSNAALITRGPDGALWFTESSASANKIGRITTAGAITEFAIPTLNSGPFGITAGPDGALWFTESSASANKIGRITTAGAVTEWIVPTPNSALTCITGGPDGALWFTESTGNKIGRITTAGSITEYVIPTPNGGPESITVGPDGALWFTELAAKKIGRITTAGAITEYSFSFPSPLGGPWGIVTGPDGALWFTENGGVDPVPTAKIGRITTAGTITEFNIPTPSSPYVITVGPDGALWFAESNKIGRVQLPLNRSGSLSHIAAGGGWTTVITLVNTSPTVVPVTLALHGDDGSPLTLPVTTTQQGVSQTTTAASVNATVNPNSTLIISLGDQLVSTVVGWADVLSSGSIGGFAIFRQTPQTGSPSEGTVPLQSQFASTLTLPYDNTSGFVMGVALANLSTSSAGITATMWDDSGNQLGTQSITIAGNGHIAFVLPNQLTLTTGRRGIVQFQSAAIGGITGLGLRFSPFGTFTSVPTM